MLVRPPALQYNPPYADSLLLPATNPARTGFTHHVTGPCVLVFSPHRSRHGNRQFHDGTGRWSCRGPNSTYWSIHGRPRDVPRCRCASA